MGSLHQASTATAPAAAARPPLVESDTAGLAGQLGSEVAETLSSALEHVDTLAATGRIDSHSLRALRDEVDRERRTGMLGQQLSRLASGSLQLSSERLDLGAMLREALRQRGREIDARGIELRQQLQPAEVVADTALTFALLHTVLDWAFEHACGRVDLTVDHQTWPPHARLQCSFAVLQPGAAAEHMLAPSTLDTLAWRLLEQTATALGLPVARHDAAGRSTLGIEFPRTLGIQLGGPSILQHGAQMALHSGKPLVGKHVLVVAARGEIRRLVREALRPHGLMIDFVTTLDEAREFCRAGLPHAVVHEAALGGGAFGRLRQELLAEAPTLAFVQITDDSGATEVRQLAGRQGATLGRAAVVASLPAALIFELSRSV
jgi:CheY-like chemotaxis protein